MSLKLTILGLFLASLTTAVPIVLHSQDPTDLLNSTAAGLSTRAAPLPMVKTANPPFDPINADYDSDRPDGGLAGDIYRVTKCYCIDTPSKDLPPVYGQYYGSYYGFDYYNYHMNKQYAFSWTCANGELESLNLEFASDEYYWLGPRCLAWMEEERKECWLTDDDPPNKFCHEVNKGKDYYYWNGQKRKVKQHPSPVGTGVVMGTALNSTCQNLCQTIPANTPGYMQDVVPSDHDNKIVLATQNTCSRGSGLTMSVGCTGPTKSIPKKFETWNYMETYSDQADMCQGCA